MLVYRIVKSKHASDISGTGAALFPGRWNKKGTPVLYTGESREIALLETLVHLPPMICPSLSMISIEIPDDSIKTLNIADLPPNWKHYPAPTVLAQIGHQWIEKSKTIALKVPSCIIPSAHNYILNCQHPDYGKVKIITEESFALDVRLRK